MYYPASPWFIQAALRLCVGVMLVSGAVQLVAGSAVAQQSASNSAAAPDTQTTDTQTVDLPAPVTPQQQMLPPARVIKAALGQLQQWARGSAQLQQPSQSGNYEVAINSSLSFEVTHRDDDLASEFLTSAAAFGSGYVKRDSVYGYLGVYARAFADVSHQPRPRAFALDLEQAYIGVLISQLKIQTGFMRSVVYESKLWGYQRALPSVSMVFANVDRGYEAQMLYSFQPYRKLNRPVISNELPYTLSFALNKQLAWVRMPWFKSYSLLWSTSRDIPTELADIYLQSGNSVSRGRYLSEMNYDMSTVGAAVDFGGDLTAVDRLSSHAEIMRNVGAPKGRGIGLWADIIYSRALASSQAARWSVGYRGYSIGSDAFLAEFASQNLGYTGVDGHSVLVGYEYDSLQVEASLWFIEPREPSIYKRKTRVVMLSVVNKLLNK